MAEDKPWVYSHTQLDLWRTCKRRYHWKYVLGNEEPTTDAMAAGTWLVQNPVESFIRGQLDDSIRYRNLDVLFVECWANFLAEFGGDDSYDGPLFTPELPKKVLAAYKANPVAGEVVAIEETYHHDFPSRYCYSSRPDLVVKRDMGKLIAFDIKFKTFNQARNGDEFFLKPALSPLDDQGISQAVCASADAFGQIQFWLGKKDGLLRGPFYLEHALNPVLANEWESETYRDIFELHTWRTITHESFPWPKNSDACNKFGRVCPAWDACNFGFVAKKLDNENKQA